jgi:phospholipase C
MPGADPGEGFLKTNYQLYSTDDPEPGAVPDNRGFVINFKAAIASDLAKHYSDTIPGTEPSQIIGMYTPELLPIMSVARQRLCRLRRLVLVGSDDDIA